VRDLAVSASGDLVAATHGRGVYVFDDLAPLREHTAALRDGVRLFGMRDAFPLRRQTPGFDGNASSADPAPATLTFYQRAPATKPLAIVIIDARGRIVRRFAGTHADDDDGTMVADVPNVAGTVRIAWALDRDAPTPWRRVAKWDQGVENGPPILSGTYTVRLLRDGKAYDRTIRILRDRAVPSDSAEREGDAFATPIYAELDALDRELNGLDNIKLAIADRVGKLRDPALITQAQAVAKDAARVENAISSQPVNDQDNDFLQDLLRERVLSFIFDLTPGTVPQSQRDEAAVLRREGASAAATYAAFLKTEVVPLDAALEKAGLTPIDLDARPPAVKTDPNADEHARRADDD
jgi:hypothetical protein